MTTINDFVKAGGWFVDESSSKTIPKGSVINVVASSPVGATVDITRDGSRTTGGKGDLDQHGQLNVSLDKALTLVLSIARKDILSFTFDDGSGRSPDGGGSSGGGH